MLVVGTILRRSRRVEHRKRQAAKGFSPGPWFRMGGLGGAAIWQAALDLVFPPRCVDCGQTEVDPQASMPLCVECSQLLRRDLRTPACPGCALPQPPDRPASAKCLECQRERFRFARAVALGPYTGHLRQVAIRMKRFDEYPLTDAVGRLLAERLSFQLGDDLPDVIVPIPKFWVKRVLYGTNTSEVLAAAIRRQLGRPAVVEALRLVRSTRKQSLLSRSQRHQNVRRALQLVQGYKFNKADVMIVDDIMTTGATASEAARVLARAGAGRITVAVAARAVHGGYSPSPHDNRRNVGRPAAYRINTSEGS